MDAPPQPPPSAAARTSGARRRLTRILLAIGFASVLLIFLQGAPRLVPDSNDDAFIFFRYARNVLQGEGPVYNPGERVEGYSSPLWLAVLVPLGAAVGMEGLPHAAQLASTAATLLCMSWLAWWLRRTGLRPAAILVAVALLCLAPAQLVWSRSGMETTTASLLLTMAATCSLDPLRSGWRVAGALASAGLLCWVRPEGPALALGIVMVTAAAGRDGAVAPRPWRRLCAQLAVVLLATGALLTARSLYYGQWLPNTYYAKISHEPEVWLRGLRYVVAFFRSHGGAPLLALAALAVTGQRRRVACALLALAAGSALIAVAEGGDFMWHGRFMQPSWPIWAALAALGVEAALEFAAGRFGARWRTAAATVLALWLIGAVSRDVWMGELGGVGNEVVYKHLMARSTGRALRKVLLPGESIVTGPAGQFVWESRAPRAWDTWGLVVPEVARSPRLRRARPGHERSNLPALLARDPDFFIVSHAWELGLPCASADDRGVPVRLSREFAGLENNASYRWVYVRHASQPLFLSFLAHTRALARARPSPLRPASSLCVRQP